MRYRLRMIRSASVFGAFRKIGDEIFCGTEIDAAALVKARRAEPGDAETAELLAPLLAKYTRKRLKALAWRSHNARNDSGA